MTILALLVWLIVIALLFWVVRAICAVFSVPAQIATVIQVLMVVICVLWLLTSTGFLSSGPVLRLQ